jgi:hypothetical protein
MNHTASCGKTILHEVRDFITDFIYTKKSELQDVFVLSERTSYLRHSCVSVCYLFLVT